MGERMSLYQNLGFKAHPFAKTNADEEPNLAEYFVPPPFYDSPESVNGKATE
jgi:hypothetical protein